MQINPKQLDTIFQQSLKPEQLVELGESEQDLLEEYFYHLVDVIADIVKVKPIPRDTAYKITNLLVGYVDMVNEFKKLRGDYAIQS